MEGIEIDIFLKICGSALLVAVVAAVLNGIGGGVKLPIKMSGTVLLYGGILLLIVPLILKLKTLSERYALAEYGTLMLRCLGIALLSEIVSDLCRDIGESNTASLVEMGGKAVILILAFPLVESLLGMVEGLL